MALFFQRNIEDFYNLIITVCVKVNDDINKLIVINLKKKLMDIFEKVKMNSDKFLIVYFKDFNLMLNGFYNKFRNFIKLKEIILYVTTINNVRTKLNNTVKIKYNVKNNKKFIVCNILEVLQDILIIHDYKCNRINKKNNLNCLTCKINFNSRVKTFIVSSLSILNLYLSQSRHSQLIFGLNEKKINKL
ncbi:hypothetical protein ABK040_006000 [Willaertia magna]